MIKNNAKLVDEKEIYFSDGEERSDGKKENISPLKKSRTTKDSDMLQKNENLDDQKEVQNSKMIGLQKIYKIPEMMSCDPLPQITRPNCKVIVDTIKAPKARTQRTSSIQ